LLLPISLSAPSLFLSVLVLTLSHSPFLLILETVHWYKFREFFLSSLERGLGAKIYFDYKKFPDFSSFFWLKFPWLTKKFCNLTKKIPWFFLPVIDQKIFLFLTNWCLSCYGCLRLFLCNWFF
jgi:hypothetical protein